jgi:hypothetical protein
MEAKIISNKAAMKIPMNEFVNKGVVIRKGKVEMAIIAEDPETFKIVKDLERVSNYFIPTLEEAIVFLNVHNIKFVIQ